MIMLKSTHNDKVAKLEKHIASLQVTVGTQKSLMETLLEENDKLRDFAQSCLTFLHDINISTRISGGKERQARRLHLFEEAQEMGVWPVEKEEEVQHATE